MNVLPFDPATAFIMLVVVTLTCTVLLFWGWLQNREERSLVWFSGGYAGVTIGNLLLATRGSAPDFLSIDIANAVILYGLTVGYMGLRIFNGRAPRALLSLTGVVVWLVACRIPAIQESFELRTIVAAGITLAIVLLCAAEALSIREGLRARYAVAGLLVVHAGAVILRIALSLFDIMSGATNGSFADVWLAPLAIEAVVFAQGLALTLLFLAKDRVETALRSVALTDSLTDLPNRRAFFDRACTALIQASRARRPVSVILFDLDRFKRINDTFGHPAGDEVLRCFATALRTTLRVGDVVGRLGGEEFGVLLPDADEQRAKVAAGRVMRAFAEEIGRHPGWVGFTTSAGLATSPNGDSSIEALLSLADAGLYDAKRQGGNLIRVQTRVEEPATATPRRVPTALRAAG